MRLKEQGKPDAIHRPLKRKVHLSPTETWSWFCSGRWVSIKPPGDLTIHRVSIETLSGLDEETIESCEGGGANPRNPWKGITPKMVEDYILKELRDEHLDDIKRAKVKVKRKR